VKTAAKKPTAQSTSHKAAKPAKRGAAAGTPAKAAKVAKAVPQPKKSTAVANKGDSEAKSLVGKNAPRFELQDQSGGVISSASLKGKPYVLYFYPKDNTPGCTQESCEFRDELRNFRASGVTIFGVSPDSVKSHVGFATKFELGFPLLSDPDKSLAQAYGVWALKKNYGREYWGIVRSTFLVDKAGKVAAEWRQVKVKGHARAVLGEVKK
jgi:peroxiredoxin Q/BCP